MQMMDSHLCHHVLIRALFSKFLNWRVKLKCNFGDILFLFFFFVFFWRCMPKLHGTSTVLSGWQCCLFVITHDSLGCHGNAWLWETLRGWRNKDGSSSNTVQQWWRLETLCLLLLRKKLKLFSHLFMHFLRVTCKQKGNRCFNICHFCLETSEMLSRASMESFTRELRYSFMFNPC